MRTAKTIMESAFKEALDIVKRNTELGNRGEAVIAAANLAIAIFSYEAEMEAMKEAHEQVDDEDDPLGLRDQANG